MKSLESTSLSSSGKRWSDVIPDGPGAAPRRALRANTSETPSVPAQIVQQIRLAGLPGSTLPWELVVSALDQRVLSTWLMCVVPQKRLPMLLWPLTIHQLAPKTWRGQLSWPHRCRPQQQLLGWAVLKSVRIVVTQSGKSVVGTTLWLTSRSNASRDTAGTVTLLWVSEDARTTESGAVDDSHIFKPN